MGGASHKNEDKLRRLISSRSSWSARSPVACALPLRIYFPCARGCHCRPHRPAPEFLEVTPPLYQMSLDWKSRRFALEETSPFISELQAKHPNHDHAEIISLIELLAFVVFACTEASGWNSDHLLGHRQCQHADLAQQAAPSAWEVEFEFSCTGFHPNLPEHSWRLDQWGG